MRHVRRAAQAIALVIELHDGHRRFRRDAIDPADDEMIEHQVADDQDRASARPIEQRLEVSRRGGHGEAAVGATGARSAAYGSVTSTRNIMRNSESPKLYSNSPAASIATITASPAFESDGYSDRRR